MRPTREEVYVLKQASTWSPKHANPLSMKEAVVQMLAETQGSIKATAQRLGLSEERVRVISNEVGFNTQRPEAPIVATTAVPVVEGLRTPRGSYHIMWVRLHVCGTAF